VHSNIQEVCGSSKIVTALVLKFTTQALMSFHNTVKRLWMVPPLSLWSQESQDSDHCLHSLSEWGPTVVIMQAKWVPMNRWLPQGWRSRQTYTLHGSTTSLTSTMSIIMAEGQQQLQTLRATADSERQLPLESQRLYKMKYQGKPLYIIMKFAWVYYIHGRRMGLVLECCCYCYSSVSIAAHHIHSTPSTLSFVTF